MLEARRDLLLSLLKDQQVLVAVYPRFLALSLAFLQLITLLEALPAAGVPPAVVEKRYGIPLGPLAGGGPEVEGWLAAAAARHTSGDSLRMATKLLDDFRCARLGAIALELPAAQ